MAVEAESLISPEGEIDPNLFPDDDPPPSVEDGSLIVRLETYIQQAEDRVAGYNLTDPDLAVTHWALYLAFRDAHTGMIARPSQEQYLGGLGGHGYSKEQIIAVADKRDEHKLAFNAAVATALTPEVYRAPHTRSVTNKFSY